MADAHPAGEGRQSVERVLPTGMALPRRAIEMAHLLTEMSSGSSASKEYLSQRFAEVMDRSFRASLSRLTLGLSPAAISLAYLDWLVHMAASPGKRIQLAEKAVRKALRLAHYMATCAMAEPDHICIEPLPNDKRFADDQDPRRR